MSTFSTVLIIIGMLSAICLTTLVLIAGAASFFDSLRYAYYDWGIGDFLFFTFLLAVDLVLVYGVYKLSQGLFGWG
jgi:hypothetical protein